MLKGRYELLEQIGQGGFAVTYRAVDHLVNRFVAIKVSTTSLQHEANVLRTLEKVPYISHMYDYFVVDGKEYLVMRLIEGTSLARRTKAEENPVTVEEMMTGLPTLVTALDQIHRHNIIHRDISPGNLILSPDGAIYLLDFESATSIDHEILSNRRVYVHKGFHAPEHLKSDIQSTAMDIYSLCATLTFLLTGHGVPDPEDRQAADPMPRILMDSSLSGRQQNAVLKGLCMDIDGRYTDIMSFAHDFFEVGIFPVQTPDAYMVRYSAKTDIGNKSVNQDNFMIDGLIPYIDEDCEVFGEIICNSSNMHIVAISDGVSNSCYAEFASKAVIQAVTHFIEQYRYSDNVPENLLEELLDQINEKIISLSKKIGTTAATLALILWKDDRYYVASIGDSAIYRSRKGHLERLTVPHTRANERMKQGESVTLTDLHTLTAYLGKKGCSGGQMADYSSGKIYKGDKFLICSDGISTGLTLDEMKSVMEKRGDSAIRVLWKYVKKRKIRDNCSAVILDFE